METFTYLRVTPIHELQAIRQTVLMMKMKFVINPFLRTILVITAWLLCIRQIYIDFNHRHFLNIILHVLTVIASIISLLCLLVDHIRYKTDKKLFSFAPTAISLLSIIGLVITSQYLKQQDKTPTVFYASRFYSGLNTIAIDFRENGTYRCKKGGFFGDTYYTRGR
jgi:NADH:ubiquinone oxidoreductase subunit 2 (subunit N)